MTKQEILNIDTTTAQKSINELKAEIKSLKEALNGAQIGSQEYAQTSEKLVTAQNRLKQANLLTKASIENFNNSIAGMEIKLAAARQQLMKMDMTTPAFKKQTQSVKELSDALNKAKMAAGMYSNNIGNYQSAFAKFGTTLKSMGGALVGFSTGAMAGVAAIRLFAKVVGNVIETNMKFEKQLGELAAITGNTIEGLKDLSDEARRLGANTLYTANEVVDLQIALAKLGYATNDIKNMEESILNFALATGAELGPAAELAGATLRAFGKNSIETHDVLNQMAVATTNSALSFSKLSTMMPIVGATANSLGMELSDTLSILGVLSNNGLEASMAATATRNIFLSLADSSSKLTKRLGFQVKTYDDLLKGLKKLKDEQISLNDVFAISDKRSVNALNILIQSTDELERVSGILSNANDEIAEMADKRMNTLAGSVEILKSAWTDLMLAFEGTNGPLKKAVDYVTELVNKMRDIVEGSFKVGQREARESGQKYISEKGVQEQLRENFRQEMENRGIDIDDTNPEKADAAIIAATDYYLYVQGKLKEAEDTLKDATDKYKDATDEVKRIENGAPKNTGASLVAGQMGATQGLLGLDKYNAEHAPAKQLADDLQEEMTVWEQTVQQWQFTAQLIKEFSDKAMNKFGVTVDSGDGSDASARSAEVARLRYELAKYLADLKTKNQNEIDYENERYKAVEKTETKIAALYEVGTSEYWNALKAKEDRAREHTENLTKITRAQYQTETKEQIAQQEYLYSHFVISQEELIKKRYEITKAGLEKELNLYSKNSKEYIQIQGQIADLDKQKEKQEMDAIANKKREAETEYSKLQTQLQKLRERVFSATDNENNAYNFDKKQLNDRRNAMEEWLDIQHELQTQAINSELLSEEEKNAKKLELDKLYEEQKAQLQEDYRQSEALLEREHQEKLRHIREDQIVKGAKDAISILEDFSDSIVDEQFAASVQGIANVFDSVINEFVNLEEELSDLRKNLGDSFTEQKQALVATGRLAAVTFNAMGGMLQGVADTQDKTTKEGFETWKKLQVASATMSMIGGVVNAIAGIPTYTEMFKALGIGGTVAGPAFGAALASMVGIMGAINIAKIQQMKFDGSTTGASTNTSALNSVVAPVQYTNNVEGASTTDSVNQEQYYVSVTEFERVRRRVSASERESRF